MRILSTVSDVVVGEYYQKNRARFGGAPLETVADAIRVRLQTGERDRELARWVWELRKRTEVRVLAGDLSGAGER